ncbi:alpha/beta fold hydrolase [Spirilliplanes yamanashiensis]|uniref:Alpha/beta hydrolase n=1 Tax=Spirilliplanes yamanashiensis TaxID=42233 RepID=A0A8J4DL94_9ACTN|nr:alpha/beta hydrolase [Spirilliplanes yamanashiensis]MDP9816621.1 pimeloyl-ACP methyl ester carboxylesterase [Spirilliplanes yamanashiensis]GIJ06147.1 alpha/beta hydrolase [Spirilliplanes yamanashiensis]
MRTMSEVRLSDGVRLHVEVSGPAEADATVVMLHGWCHDRRTWHRQAAALPEALGGATARIVAYDQRGHGRSGATHLRSATLEQLGDDLAAVVDEAAPRGPVVLAGHSLGGMAIMEYAHRHPETFGARVGGLVFVGTTAEGHTHTRYGLPTPLAGVLRTAETMGAGVLARCGAWRPHRAVLPALSPGVRWLLFGDEYESADLDICLRALGRASLRSIGGFRTSVGAQLRLDTLAALGDVPAAVLVGDKDRLTPPACARSIADALPGAALTVAEGAGHMLMMERPQLVTDALADVVARATASGEWQTGYEQAA